MPGGCEIISLLALTTFESSYRIFICNTTLEPTINSSISTYFISSAPVGPAHGRKSIGFKFSVLLASVIEINNLLSASNTAPALTINIGTELKALWVVCKVILA